MTKKPSLYVVERKEVVILVVLFVLITVFGFTMGVRYGENLGRRKAQEKQNSEAALAESPAVTGGRLGENSAAPAHANAHAKSPGSETAPTAVAAGAGGQATVAAVGNEHKPEATDSEHSTGANPAPTMEAGTEQAGAANSAVPSPTAAVGEAGASEHAEKTKNGETTHIAKADVQDTDEYLLNALKEAGIERAQAKSGALARKSPEPADTEEQGQGDDSKSARAGADSDEDEPRKLPTRAKGKTASRALSEASWVIQVASYTTEQEAKRHADRLRAQNLAPMIFSGMDSQNGKWYRVALGKYSDKERAGEVARTYKAKGWIGSSSFVRKAP